MANFKILSASQFDPRLRVRVQATGKLGFSEETTNKLRLSTNTYILFALDDVSAPYLYMVVQQKENKDAFQVKKSGKYFYLSTQRLFDSLNIDYKNQNVIYDLVRMEGFDKELEGEVYRMNYRTTSGSKNDEEDADEENS